MILSKFTFIKITAGNHDYWKKLNYDIKPLCIGRNGGPVERIKVSINDLMPKSDIYVSCRCNECNEKYLQRFSRNKEICRQCRQKIRNIGNKYGTAHKGRKNPNATSHLKHFYGEDHPNWNPNKPEFLTYASKVRFITEATYISHKNTINPLNKPRTLCGVLGGWQLDHIISIKKGFIDGIDPKIISSLDNLQMLPWEHNRQKWH